MMQAPSSPPDEDLAHAAPATPNRLQCSICDRTFARTEHLRRHTLTHTKTRPFRCSICDKEFFRRAECSRDALQRHLITHQHPEPSLLQKGVRACQPCAAAKARCSGDFPCSRCRQRSIACQPGKRGSETFDQPSPRATEPAAQASPVHRRLSFENVWATPTSRPVLPQPGVETTETHHVSQPIPRQYADISTPSVERASYILQELKFTHAPVQQQQPVMGSPLAMQSPPSLHVNGRLSFSSGHQSGRAQSSAPDQGAMMIPPRDQDPIVHQSPALFDMEPWNSNFPSTINWLTDATFGLENPIVPLSLSDSVYFNDFPHMFGPFVSNQPVELPQTPLDHTPGDGPSWLQDDARTHMTVSSDNASESLHSDETRARSGQFYIDSDSSRLPRVKRRKYNTRPVDQKQSSSDVQYSLQSPANFATDMEPPYEIQSESYDKLIQMFQHWCVTPPVPFTPFVSAKFPPKSSIDHMISLYFQSFQPVIPLLHSPTFVTADPPWLLVLAMAAIGSHFLDVENFEIFSFSMHEFLRRMLSVAEEDSSLLPANTVTRVQIKLLYTVGALYSGNERLRQSAFRYDRELTEFCQQHWQSADDQPAALTGQGTVDAEWYAWRDQEVRCRTGYCVWLLDCMWAFQFNRRPQLSLEDAKVPLPCSEKLWAARHVQEWQQLKSTCINLPSLLSALQKIYIEKYLSPDLGEFSRTLLIHGLFHRSWEVETYFRQNLSRWEPTARKGSAQDPQLQSPVWLPSIQTYAKWRNSTCDCLDILHWSANATIGTASGMEHPTVMHLHLARVILLTPYNEIVRLARFSVEGPSSYRQSDVLDCEQTIRKWATQDQYKARLAMIHAGVLFWHVRRFSANGFYEPISVALATLALWAFATFHNKPLAGAERDQNAAGTPRTPARANAIANDGDEGPKQNADGESDSDEPIGCDIILLDRPTDDELVQNFVRRGHTMVANLAGVGNLYGERGPELVLQEGRKILYGLNSWGIRHKWLEILDGLLDVTKRKRK